jgi:SiaC family regulatory phosphoprotein
MKKLVIEKTDSTPLIILDQAEGIYQISGQSRPSDVREFYNQIISWLNEFTVFLKSTKEYNDPIIFIFNLDYFNSSSAKLIVDICKILAGIKNSGYNVVIKWHYEEEDSDMLEAGKEISQIVNCPFEYLETA